jgi:hypothetical protein
VQLEIALCGCCPNLGEAAACEADVLKRCADGALVLTPSKSCAATLASAEGDLCELIDETTLSTRCSGGEVGADASSDAEVNDADTAAD